MDGERFSTLVKSLTTTGTRRGLLTRLAALPAAGGLATLLEPEGAARRKGRDLDITIGRPKQSQRGIKLRILNGSPEDRTLHIEFGMVRDSPSDGFHYCTGHQSSDLRWEERVQRDTREPFAYLWVEKRYFMVFINPETFKPHVQIVDRGSAAVHCRGIPLGGTLVFDQRFAEKDKAEQLLPGDFGVRIDRLDDSEAFKIFSVILVKR